MLTANELQRDVMAWILTLITLQFNENFCSNIIESLIRIIISVAAVIYSPQCFVSTFVHIGVFAPQQQIDKVTQGRRKLEEFFVSILFSGRLKL